MSVDLAVAHPMQNRVVHRAVLHNGIVVLAVENPAADIIAARIFVRSGSRYETRSQAGLFHLMSSVLLKGTDRDSAQDIAEQVESVGASLAADTTSDYSLISLKTVSADFADMLQLASEVMRSPSFPEAEVALEQRLTIQGIRSMQEQPFSIAQRQLQYAMYGEHPYALPSIGTEESVASLTREDLCRIHAEHFRPDNLVISIVGHIVPDEAIALVDQIFGDWPIPSQEGQPLPLPTMAFPSLTLPPTWVTTAQDTMQSIVMLGYLGTSVHATDYIPLKLLNTHLGNGLSSRLFVELREKRGLAYEVSAYYPTRSDASQFVVYMGTAPQNTTIALDGLRQEVERLCHVPLTEDELQVAKNKLLGQYALGKQTNAQIAQIFGWYETLGLGLSFDQQFQERMNEVTTEMAQAAAQKYFGDPYVSLVGPAEAIASVGLTTVGS
jgi:zinc protease